MKKDYFYVYILTNYRKTVLYIGVTNDLKLRVAQHRQGMGSQFTAKYKVNRLVYYEFFTDPEQAIRREKVLKNYSRKNKEKLIEKKNPEWKEIDVSLVL